MISRAYYICVTVVTVLCENGNCHVMSYVRTVCFPYCHHVVEIVQVSTIIRDHCLFASLCLAPLSHYSVTDTLSAPPTQGVHISGRVSEQGWVLHWHMGPPQGGPVPAAAAAGREGGGDQQGALHHPAPLGKGGRGQEHRIPI